MTKFAKAAIKAQTLEIIYNAVQQRLEWDVYRDDEQKPLGEEEAYKAEVIADVLKTIEKML